MRMRSLFDSGILDSFALTDVITAVEKEFSIKVPDSDLTPRKFNSISRIVRLYRGAHRLSSVCHGHG